ncbi:MAG: hypothetical protein OEV87_01265 [Phycisphaerae bacterium]|nr:hypothetical protein [Phycisphaerae bacterium]
MNMLIQTNVSQTPVNVTGILSIISTFFTWYDTELSPYVGDLLKFYGLTAGFILTLYALYTKDVELRQTRRELHRVLIVVLFAFILQCLAWILVNMFKRTGAMPGLLLFLAIMFYAFSLIYFFLRVVILAYLRVEKFKERSFLQSVKHFPVIRYGVKKIESFMSQHYEISVQDRIPLDKYTSLTKLVPIKQWQTKVRGFSLLVAYENTLSWLQLISKITKEHIENGETVTLITCRHHPSLIISYLEASWGEPNQSKLRNNMVIIDGFTELFGGDDEIFKKTLVKHRSDGYKIFHASSTPGIHSGCAKAFKYFKKVIKGKRLPGTVIYDGLLVYRYCEEESFLTRFLIHMIEAERTYSMVTLIGEPSVEMGTPSFKSIFSLVDYPRFYKDIDNISELKYPEKS